MSGSSTSTCGNRIIRRRAKGHFSALITIAKWEVAPGLGGWRGLNCGEDENSLAQNESLRTALLD